MNNRVGIFFGQGRQFLSDTRQQGFKHRLKRIKLSAVDFAIRRQKGANAPKSDIMPASTGSNLRVTFSWSKTLSFATR